jgi:hypothetical protein
VLLSLASTDVAALTNSCTLINNFPVHISAWTSLDLIIYERGVKDTSAINEDTDEIVLLPDLSYVKAELNSNNAIGVSLQSSNNGVPFVPPQPPTPGTWDFTGLSNIFYTLNGQEVGHGQQRCREDLTVT